MAHAVDWTGFSFKVYSHFVYEWTHTFRQGPGNYILCSIDANDIWDPIYIGETCDLSKLFHNHPKMQCVMAVGATHIHAHTNKRGEQARLNEKQDLIYIYDPICQYI